MTEKLYDFDSHIKEFSAVVLKSGEDEKGKYVILDKTAFFPEGGGQGSDKGTINGMSVLDVQETNGEIRHYTEVLFNDGELVQGEIDWESRFRHMQNHSGEHIISGIAHSLYGLENVGFHLGQTEVTLDFNGFLSREQLLKIESLANEAIYKNVPFIAEYPEKDRLKCMEYRSKLDLQDNVRIVTIPDYDACACCAPHVKTAAEIGIIKILDFYKMRGGIRVYIKCGKDALADYNEKYSNVYRISELLCAKQSESFDAVERLQRETSSLKHKISELKKAFIGAKISAFKPESEITALFEEELDIKELQLYADGLYKSFGGIRAVFSAQTNGYGFAICSKEDTLASFFGKMKQSLNIRGGGRNGMVQGTVLNTKEEITEFFNRSEL